MAGQNLSAAGLGARRRGHRRPPAERIGNLAVLDLGVKQATIDNLAARGFDVHVLPQDVTIDDIRAIDPVAVFYSNGPGDPAASGRPRRAAARRARRRPAVLRHLLRQPAARPRARPRHLQAAVRPPRHQPAGARQVDRPRRDHRAQPRLRRRRAARGRVRQPERLRARRGEPRRPQRPGRRGPARPRHPRLLGAVPPRGRGRPARRQLPLRPLPRPGRRGARSRCEGTDTGRTS